MHIVSFFINYILSFVILIAVLVFIHEFGHFLFARLCGVFVESFSIGFGKEIFGFTDKKGTRWRVAPIPLGGYVKMKGELSNVASEAADEVDSFSSKKLWQRFLIVFAGPLFNLILPIIIFLSLTVFVGSPDVIPKVDSVLKGSPAYNILQKGDVVLAINNTEIKTFSELTQIISKSPNQNVLLKIKRDNTTKVIPIKVGERKSSTKEGFLGVSVNSGNIFYKKHKIKDGIVIAFDHYTNMVKEIVKGLYKLVSGQVRLNDMGGPIKIAQLSGNILQNGVVSWVYFLAVLSINLAIINLLPIPALDGGYLFLYIIEGITGKKLSPRVHNILVSIGFVILMGLMLIITINDVINLIK